METKTVHKKRGDSRPACRRTKSMTGKKLLVTRRLSYCGLGAVRDKLLSALDLNTETEDSIAVTLKRTGTEELKGMRRDVVVPDEESNAQKHRRTQMIQYTCSEDERQTTVEMLL